MAKELLDPFVNSDVHMRNTDSYTVEEIPDKVLSNKAYLYLVFLEESRRWLSKILGEPLNNYMESMKKGIPLAQLSYLLIDQLGLKLKVNGRSTLFDSKHQYKYTENINLFLETARSVGLPDNFLFDTVDLYDSKNLPQVVFCLHCLASNLESRNIFPGITDLFGKVQFTEAELRDVEEDIDLESVPRIFKDKPAVSEHLSVSEAFCILHAHVKYRIHVFNSYLTSAIDTAPIKNFMLMLKECRLDSRNMIPFFHTFLQLRAFDAVYYRKHVTPYSVKQFLFIVNEPESSLRDQTIDSYYSDIESKNLDVNKLNEDISALEDKLNLYMDQYVDSLTKKQRTAIEAHSALSDIRTALSKLQMDPKKVLSVGNLELLFPLFDYRSDREHFFLCRMLNLLGDEGIPICRAIYNLTANPLRERLNTILHLDIDIGMAVDEISEAISDSGTVLSEKYIRNLKVLRGIVSGLIQVIEATEYPFFLSYFVDGCRKRFLQTVIEPALMLSELGPTKIKVLLDAIVTADFVVPKRLSLNTHFHIDYAWVSGKRPRVIYTPNQLNELSKFIDIPTLPVSDTPLIIYLRPELDARPNEYIPQAIRSGIYKILGVCCGRSLLDILQKDDGHFSELKLDILRGLEGLPSDNQYLEVLEDVAKEIISIKLLSYERSRELEECSRMLHSLDAYASSLMDIRSTTENYLNSFIKRVIHDVSMKWKVKSLLKNGVVKRYQGDTDMMCTVNLRGEQLHIRIELEGFLVDERVIPWDELLRQCFGNNFELHVGGIWMDANLLKASIINKMGH